MATALTPSSPSSSQTQPHTSLTFDIPSSQLTQNQFGLPQKFVKLAQLTNSTQQSDETTLLILQNELYSYLNKHPEYLPNLLNASPSLAKAARNHLKRIKYAQKHKNHLQRFRYYYPRLQLKKPLNDKEVACQTPTPQHMDLSLSMP